MSGFIIPSSMDEMERALQEALADARLATPSLESDHTIGLIQDLLGVAQSPQPSAAGHVVVVMVDSQPRD